MINTGSGVSGPGQRFGQPLPPVKGGPQSVQNGPSFGGHMQQQFPPHGSLVGSHTPTGAHPAGFHSPTTGPHPQNTVSAPPIAAQLNNLALNDQSKTGLGTGFLPGQHSPSMPPSGGQINGSSAQRSFDPPPSLGASASVNNVGSPSNRVNGSYAGQPPSNLSYTQRSTGPPPSSMPGVVPSSMGNQLSRAEGSVLRQSSLREPLQPSSIGGPPQSSSTGSSPQPFSAQRPAPTQPTGDLPTNPSVREPPLSSFIQGPVQQPYVGRPPLPASTGGPPHPSSIGQPPSSSIGRPPPPFSIGSPPQIYPPGGGPVPPPNNEHQQYSPSAGAGHYQGGFHEQGQHSQRQQFQPPPPSSATYGIPPHPGHSTHPPQTGGQYPPPPPGQSAHPPQTGGQYPPPPPGQSAQTGGQYPPPPPGQSAHPPQTGGQYPPPPPGQSAHPPQTGGQFPPPPLGQSAHPPQTGGQYPPSPGQGHVSQPSGASGHFPGSAPYVQQPQPVQPTQQHKRLDPDQIPSPIQVIEDDRKNRSGIYQTNTKGSIPPLVTTKYVTHDQGNASPGFIRSTMYNVPCTADMLKSSHIPFALSLTPFAELGDREQPLPIVDLGALGPVRCKRCKAYMSPVMQFIDGGRRFQCAFCSAVTDVPEEYFAHLDHTGRRADCYNRPELCLGSYEFVVTKDYCKNGVPPKEPAFIFMIDVSYNSIKSGIVQLICDKLKSEILVHLPKEANCQKSEIRVGFITYHKELHFYNIKKTLTQPQMMVVSDLEDIFVPLLDGFLVTLSESEALIDSLLSQIPHLFAESKVTELVLGPVIQAGLDALRSADRAGRLYIFHSGLPSAEAPGKLKARDDRKLLGTDKEKNALTAQTPFYNKLGIDCVAAGCSVDLFLFPNQYIDVVTVSDVCKVTGGNIFKYSYFQADIDGERFLADLKTSVKRSQAFDAILRVRTSTGIRPVDFYGNFYMANTTDVEMASIDSDSSVCVDVKHDDKLSETEGAYVQVAVLYTSVTGQRRLRCHNLSLNCCNQMQELFRSCELDTLINFFAKQALRSCLSTSPKQVREHITNEVAQILACYRKNCANPSSPGQLVLPECMKLLPLYANCVLKNDSISGSSEISTDDRGYLMHLMSRMDVEASNVFFYPRLLPVHKFDLDTSEFPVAIRCSMDRLEDSGMYILENGLSMFMWIGRNVNSELIQKIFAVPDVSHVDIDKVQLLQLDNPVSHRICQLVTKIREERSRYLKLIIVRQGDKLQPWFEHFLVEDKGQYSGSSYVDFLLHIHTEIRNIIS